MNLQEKIEYLYKHASAKKNDTTDFVFENDEQKLFIATHTYINKSLVKEGRWWIDWNLLDAGCKGSSKDAWDNMCKRRGNGHRNKTFQPRMDLFEQEFDSSLFDKDESNFENIHRIYNETGKIYHRDTLQSYRKSHTSRDTANRSKYNDKHVEAIIGQLRKMPAEGCEKVLEYLAKNYANKVCKKVTIESPEWMKELALKFSKNVPLRAGTLDSNKLAKLGILGFELCEYEEIPDSAGDTAYLAPTQFHDFHALSKDKQRVDDYTLAVRETVRLARCMNVKSNKVYIDGEQARHLGFNAQLKPNEYGFPRNYLTPMLLSNWNAHSDEFKAWLTEPANFHSYHCYRESHIGTTDAIWKFNLIAICLSIYKDLGYLLNPMSLKLVIDAKPELIEGSPLVMDGGLTMVLKQ